MAKKTVVQAKPEDLVKELLTKGVEQKMPHTGRVIRLKPINAQQLLTDGKMPDILTPLVVKSIYQDIPDKEVRDFLNRPVGKKEDALKYLEAINFICAHTIADGTKVDDLLISEKRWVFRLVMGAAETLITFRYDEEADVEPVAEVEPIQPATE